MKAMKKVLTIISLFAAVATMVQAKTVDYEVHEWGTFTSLQSSDGVELSGLHHEEEPLPSFVLSRSKSFGMVDSPFNRPMFCKGFVCPGQNVPGAINEKVPENVTQKMETPVVYFYAKETLKSKVKVDFPKGIISQYYPDAQTFQPAIGSLRDLENGSMTFDVDVLTEDVTIPRVGSNSIYKPSRQVKSNFIRNHKGQNAKLIFYRGLGRFSMPVKVSMTKSLLRIDNNGKHAIPGMFAINFDGTKGAIKKLGSLETGKKFEIKTMSDLVPSLEGEAYLNHAHSLIKESLVASGLFADEADAMINTWRAHYFKTPGIRVLYVLPRAMTEEILPMQITPQPTKVVRTLVSRVEVLSQNEENALVSLFSEKFLNGETVTMADIKKLNLGTLAEAKLLRVKQITDGSRLQEPVRKNVESLINALNNPLVFPFANTFGHSH